MIHFGKYFGKKTNLYKRIDICSNCNNTSELTFFEAPEYFHISFIPIFPLGRKKVVEKCSHCGNYFAQSVEKWQLLRQEALNSVKKVYQSDQINEDTLIDLYETIHMFCSNQEVVEFENSIKQQYAHFPKLMASIRNNTIFLDMSKETIDLLKERLNQDSSDINSIYLLGWTYFEKGEFESAKNELIKINPIKTRNDFSKLISLAKKLKGESRYEILKQIFKYDDEFSSTHGVLNKLVRTTEKELGIHEKNSIASIDFDRSKMKEIKIALLIVSCLILFFSMSFYHKFNHMNLFIVNGHYNKIHLTIENKLDTTLVQHDVIRIDVSPKEYLLNIKNKGTTAKLKFNCEVSFIDFIINNPVFVVNPDGAGMLLHQEIVYSNMEPPPEGNSEKLTGEEYYYFSHVDYIFQDIPESISIDGAQETKIALTLVE